MPTIKNRPYENVGAIKYRGTTLVVKTFFTTLFDIGMGLPSLASS